MGKYLNKAKKTISVLSGETPNTYNYSNTVTSKKSPLPAPTVTKSPVGFGDFRMAENSLPKYQLTAPNNSFGNKANLQPMGIASLNLPAKGVGEINLGTTRSNLAAGAGSVQSFVGGALDYVGQKLGAESFSNKGKQMVSHGEETFKQRNIPYSKEFTWKSFVDPEFYQTTLAQQVPIMASLLMASAAGALSGGAVAGAAGAGAFATGVLSALGATTFGGGLEALGEAGSTFEESLNRGMSPEEADNNADYVFKANLALKAKDPLEWFLALTPATKVGGKIAKTVKKAGNLGKAAEIGAKGAFIAASEGGEEVLQNKFQSNALGDPWSLDTPENRESFAIGAFYGLTMTGMGAAMSHLKAQTISTMNKSERGKFDQAVGNLESVGLDRETATNTVIDEYAKTPKGEAYIKKVVDKVLAKENAGEPLKNLGVEKEIESPEGSSDQMGVKPPEGDSDAFQNRIKKILENGDSSVKDSVKLSYKEAEKAKLLEIITNALNEGRDKIEIAKEIAPNLKSKRKLVDAMNMVNAVDDINAMAEEMVLVDSAKKETVKEEGKEDVSKVQKRVESTTEDAIASFEKQTIRESAGIIPEGTRLYEAALSDKETRVGEKIASLFGHKLVHISPKSDLKGELLAFADRFNGTIYKNTIYINKNRFNSAHAVAGHEITHPILDDPEIGGAFLEALKPLINKDGWDHIKETIALYGKHGIALSEDKALREFASDFVGEQMTKKAFWNKLSEKVPEAVKKAIATIKKMLRGLKAEVNKANQAEQFITELQTALDLATDAYALHLEKSNVSEVSLSQIEKNIMTDLRRQGRTLKSASENLGFVMNLMVAEQLEYLQQTSGNGVEQGNVTFTDEGDFASKSPRISRNPKWYSDFYRDYGRSPGKKELKKMAIDHLRNGFDDFTMSVPPNEQYLELEGLKNVYEGIEEKLAFGVDKGLSEQGDKEPGGDSKAVNYQVKGQEEVLTEKSSTGKVIKIGNKVYKNTTNRNGKETMEAEVYSVLEGTPGIAPGKLVEQNGKKYIETPYYENMVSIDDVPRPERKNYADIVYENSQLINGAISALSNAGYKYSDPLQFGIKGKTMDLLDFSNAGKKNGKYDTDPLDDNFSLLTSFYKTFGAEKLSNIISEGMRLKRTASLYTLKDIEKGKTLLNKKEQEEIRTLLEIKKSGDFDLNNVYYTTNARFIQIKSKIAQTEKVDGVKYIYSENPLSAKEISDWELKKIYEQPSAYYQLKSEAFKKWFGDSKVVDEKGEPLVVYHGTNEDFNVFDKDKIGNATDDGMWGSGFYFADKENTPYGTKIKKVYLSIENPLILADFKTKTELADYLDVDENILTQDYGSGLFRPLNSYINTFTSHVEEKGHDGIFVTRKDSMSEYIAFEPAQIKSATDNTGSFNPDNPDIRYQLKVDEVMKTLGDKKKAESLVEWFGESKVVDRNGMPKPLYSGHSNAELYGDTFDPKKATSGGFYATDDPKIASNYSEQKIGVKEYWENAEQYRIYNYKTKKFNKKIDSVYLTDKQLETFNEWWQETYGRTLGQYIKENVKYDANLKRFQYGGTRSLLSHFCVMESLGDTIAYAKQGDEPLYVRQLKSSFEKLLDKAGIKWQSYDWMQPGVMKVFLKIENPLDTSKSFPKDVMASLEKIAKREKRMTDDEWRDAHWTKDYPVYKWIEDIKTMEETGEETFWATQIPTKARTILKELGYDGIKDVGGKMGGSGHEVWIALDSNQVKSAIGNKGTFKDSDKRMQYQLKNPMPWADQQQEITSEKTSINATKLPRTFNVVKFVPGTINADIGGGRFDNATDYLKKQNVTNYIYDPYNRNKAHNKEVLNNITNGQSDTATINNVLNVIKEEDAREQVIVNAADAIKQSGVAYFLTYEGNGSGTGNVSTKGWQENRKTRDYITEIEKYFNNVRLRNGLIEAREPIKLWKDKENKYQLKPINPGDIKERSFPLTVEDAPWTSEEAKKEMETDRLIYAKTYYYDVAHNPDTIAEAERIIKDDRVMARDMALSDKPDPVGTAISLLLMKEAHDTQDWSTFLDLLEHTSEKGTKEGQSIQVLSLWGRITPEGIVRYAKRAFDKATTPKQDQEIKLLTGQIEKDMTDANKKAIEDAIKLIAPTLDEMKRMSAAEKLAKMISSHLKKPSERSMWKEMIKTLYTIAKEQAPLPEKAKLEKVNYMEFIGEALRDKEQYMDVWEKAKFTVTKKYKNDPDAQEKLKNYFDMVINKPYPDSYLNKAIGEELKELKVKISDLAKMHYSKANDFKGSLAKRLVEQAGLDEVEAKHLENLIYQKMTEATLKEKENILKKMFKPREQRKQRELWEKMLELSNLGGYQLPQYRSLVAEKLGIPRLSKKLSDSLYLQSQLIQTMSDGREKHVAVQQMLQDVADAVPSSVARKVNTIQTMAQLLNPKTIVRNLVGNTGFGVLENISEMVAVPLDLVARTVLDAGKQTKIKVAAGPKLKAQLEGLQEGWKLGLEDALLGIDTGNNKTQFDLPKGKTFKKGIFSGLETTLNIALRATDRAFYMAAIKSSLVSQMEAAKVTEPTEEMIKNATLLGLYRTFQDENSISKMAVGIKRTLNIAGLDKMGLGEPGEFGLGDLILKYPKTPSNILARGLDYSPIGIIMSISKLLADTTGDKYLKREILVKGTSRAVTGTTLMVLGWWLATMKILVGNREDDYDVAALNKTVGLFDNQINVSALWRLILSGFDSEAAKLKKGDKLASYDWFQPQSINIAMGADIAKNEGKFTGFMGTLMGSIEAATNTLAEQPMVSGLTRLFKCEISKAFTETLKSIPSSFTPTLMNQIVQFLDNQRKEVYDPNWSKVALNLAKRKIPGLSDNLPNAVGVWGEDLKNYDKNSFFNVFFNPAFVWEYDPSPEAQLVLDLYERTGEAKIAPRLQQKKLQIDGQEIVLTPKEYTSLQKFVGQKVQEKYRNFAKGGRTNLPDKAQVKALYNILNDVGGDGRDFVKKMRGL